MLQYWFQLDLLRYQSNSYQPNAKKFKPLTNARWKIQKRLKRKISKKKIKRQSPFSKYKQIPVKETRSRQRRLLQENCQRNLLSLSLQFPGEADQAEAVHHKCSQKSQRGKLLWETIRKSLVRNQGNASRQRRRLYPLKNLATTLLLLWICLRVDFLHFLVESGLVCRQKTILVNHF